MVMECPDCAYQIGPVIATAVIVGLVVLGIIFTICFCFAVQQKHKHDR